MLNYVNYRQYSVRFNEADRTFDVLHGEYGAVLRGVTVAVLTRDLNGMRKRFAPADFSAVHSTIEKHWDSNCLAVGFSGGREEDLGLMTIRFTADSYGVTAAIDSNPEPDYQFCIQGEARWGGDCEHDTFSMRCGGAAPFLRAALGPASSPCDNVLFDRANDRGLMFRDVRRPGLRFDYDKGCYRFDARFTGNEPRRFRIEIEERLYERKYAVRYAPARKRGGYSRPPVGWMTWYAVKFDACEKTVLDNARAQAELLRDWGADTVWVDWEWYHSAFTSGETNCDTMHPDASKYPNGLAYVADRIRELGFVPAIWIGASHEVRESEFIRNNPDTILINRTSWCGPYWFDPTHPGYLHKFIPDVFRMLTEWGYRAIKWDALPRALDYFDMYHDRFHDPGQSSEQAMRAVVQKARDVVGEDVYMLSCHGESWRDIAMYADTFDAARIGADIFGWEEFARYCVGRMYRLYHLHNIMHLLDPDNVVIRAEFNTLTQARSRASFVALAGAPITFGDDLTALPEDRVEILRRAIPSMDVHTMDVEAPAQAGDIAGVHLFIKTRCEEYHVVDLLNLREERMRHTVRLSDIELDDGPYLVFDFWNRRFLGKVSSSLDMTFEPHESRVLSFRKATGAPQLVSTSRHITQGACEIREMVWDAQKLELRGVSDVVKGDPYKLYLHVPEGYTAKDGEGAVEDGGLFVLTYTAKENGEYRWHAAFAADCGGR
jgi:hypothetical protein